MADALLKEKMFDAHVVLRDVIGTIAQMHAHGVIRGDIKPSNILLKEDGKTARMSDIGWSRCQIEKEMKLQKMALDTLTYMPPEIHSFTKTKRRRSWDSRSLCIVICEMLCNDDLQKFADEQQTNSVEASHSWASAIEDEDLRSFYVVP